jgi:sulfhydrogenase subunit beta (sulfur reductase)
MLLRPEPFLAFLGRCFEETSPPYEEIYLPVAPPDVQGGASFFKPFPARGRPVLDGYRSVDPLKSLFYLARERVAPLAPKPVRRLIVGAKACDLKGLELLDRALINDDFRDPAYAAWREETTLISFDCTEAAPTCHCTLVGGLPYAESGFDLNVSPVEGRYLLTPASEKGNRFLAELKARVPLEEPEDRIRAAVRARREDMAARVRAQNEAFRRPDDYARLRSAPPAGWAESSAECVGCGACTHICPTCYCLILNEEGGAGSFIKDRSYDSCQWHGYARVASGASPRPRISERFRHRYLCKFVSMNGQFGRLGCTGCGRCTEACPGGIEFRDVVRRMLGEPPHASPGPAAPR